MIADNRLTEIASWDDRLLAQQLKDLSVLGLDFSLELTGFEVAEIDLRIASLNEVAEPADDPADALPEETGPSVSKIGDLWHLGRHRLLCGDARDDHAMAELMGQERATMAFTDPPYNVKVQGHAGGLGAIQHRPFPMASGEMDEPEFTAFLARAFRNLVGYSTEGSLHYICMDWRHLDEVLAAGKEVYAALKNLCVWVKDNAGMGALSIAVSMSSCSSSNMGATRIATTYNLGNSAAAAAMSGSTLGSILSAAAVRRAIS